MNMPVQRNNSFAREPFIASRVARLGLARKGYPSNGLLAIARFNPGVHGTKNIKKCAGSSCDYTFAPTLRHKSGGDAYLYSCEGRRT